MIFSNISFATSGNLLLLKHQTPSQISILNSVFTKLTSAKITMDSLGSKNSSLYTKSYFENCTFNSINTKYSSMLNTENKAILTVNNSAFTNIFSYEEAAILYAGFEKTFVTFNNIIFSNNSAIKGTMFVIQSESSVSWTNWTIFNNFGITNTVFETSTNGYFMFYNSKISYNYAINGPLGELLDSANLWIISSSSIYSNEALTVDEIKYELSTKWSKLCFVPQLFIDYVYSNSKLIQSKFSIALIKLILSSLSIQDSSTIK